MHTVMAHMNINALSEPSCILAQRRDVDEGKAQSLSPWPHYVAYHACLKNDYQAFSEKCVTKNSFSYFSTKTNVVGTQKNRLNETICLSVQNMLKLIVKKIFTILRSKCVFI